MSGFTESAFERKLAELNPSQQSIQTLSIWLIHHRKHYSTIVKLWYKEFLKAQEHRKLTFIYLANDVIQNSRKKGGEFGKAFAPIFKKTLEYMARIPHEKTKKSILRILSIWEERHIYDTPLIKDFEKSYKKVWSDLHDGEFDDFETGGGGITTPPHRSPKEESISKPSNDTILESLSETVGNRSSISEDSPDGKNKTSPQKRKGEHNEKSNSKDKYGHKRHSQSHSGGESVKRVRTKKEEIDSALRKRSMEATNTIDEWEVDGVVQIEVKLSPSPFKDPPTEEELIQMTKDLEKMPSTDAITRGKIANVPPEVSDVSGVDEICIDSDVSRVLQKKIQMAADLLQDYNKKLDIELDDRKNASMKLQDFIHHQKDLLTQAEHRLEEHQNHSRILSKKLEDLKAHVQSMPDFTKLPSVTDGLAPLPSAGDLFNLCGRRRYLGTMGGAVSSGESNDDLIDNLLDSDYIKTALVERVFRGVDRAFYYTNPYKQNAYKDLAWKDGNLHLSAPCIYSEVMENIQIEEGMSFLNIGSGTGYLSTMVGLILGRQGVNHGIELYEDVVDYARLKLDEFLKTSPAVDMFDFCEPEFVVGNCLEVAACPKRYDRIYCGAACPEPSVQTIIDLLKIGGVCIVPINDSLIHITRISASRMEMKTLLPVSFASLVVPKQVSKPVSLPELNPMSLGDLCRAEIRSLLRKAIAQPEVRNQNEAVRRRRRRKRQERRRASRLLVVQRRRSGGEPDGDQNGFVAIAYSMGRNSRNRNRRNSTEERDSDDAEDRVARRSSDQEMDGLSSDEDVDFSDMPALNDVEVMNDAPTEAENVVLSTPVETTQENGQGNPSGNETVNAPDSSSPVATSSRSSQIAAEIPPDCLPKIRPAASQVGSGSRGSDRSSGFLSMYRAKQHSRATLWRQRDPKRIHMTPSGLPLPKMPTSLRRRGSPVVPDGDNQFPEGEDMLLSSSSSDDDYEFDGYDSDPMDGRNFQSNAVEEDDDTYMPSVGTSNGGPTILRCQTDSEDEQNEDEHAIGRDSKMPNTYSIKMREKIQALPLPPAMKVYLNYNRQFQ